MRRRHDILIEKGFAFFFVAFCPMSVLPLDNLPYCQFKGFICCSPSWMGKQVWE
jgi:hypothetical protein